MIRKTAIAIIVITLFTATGAGQLLVSTPNTVSSGSTFGITIDTTRNASYDLSLDISDIDAGVEADSLNGSYSVSLEAPGTGSYTVMASATYPDGTTESARSIFRVRSYSAVDIIPVTASPSGNCGFNGLHNNCRVLAVNLSSVSSSPFEADSELAVRGGSVTVDGTTRYLRVTGSDQYTTVHIDDDTTFQETNETGSPEFAARSGQEAFSDSRLTVTAITRDRVLFHVPPTADERPLRDGDDLSVALLARNGSAVAQGIEVSATISELGGQILQSADLDSGIHGITETISVSDLGSGRYSINAENSSRSVVSVQSFDIGYTITDGTGARTRTVSPGTDLTVEAAPVIDGSSVSPDSRSTTLILPDGSQIQSDDTAISVPDDARAGTATVRMTVTHDGVERTVSTSLDIKTFKVMTIPLRETEYGLANAQGFAPGSEGHLFIGAVKLGTAGSIQELQQATFFPLENLSTGSNECSDNVGDLEGQLNSQEITIETNATSLSNSSLIDPATEFPTGFMSQCILSFTIPNATGTITGSVAATRERTDSTETGSVLITSRRFDAEGRAVDPSTGDRNWLFGTSDRIGIEPRIYSLDTNEQINSSKITDMSLLRLQGPGAANATFRNASRSDGPMLVIDPVTASGSYRAVFRATINRSGGTGFATGRAYFNVRSLLLDVDRQGGYGPVDPSTTMRLSVTARTPYGSTRSGVPVAVESVRNTRTDEDLIDTVRTTTNVTGSDGTTVLTVDPDGRLPRGDYRIVVNATTANGTAEDTLYQDIRTYSARIGSQGRGQPVIGDELNLTARVRYTTNDSAADYSIDAEETAMVYLGQQGAVSRERLDLADNLTVSDGRLIIETAGLESGLYRIDAALDVGDRTIMADSYIRLPPFATDIRTVDRGQTHGPDSTVPINISLGSQTTFTATLEEFEGRRQRYNISQQPTEQETFEGRQWALFNLTIPSDAGTGYHRAELEVNTSSGSVRENVGFEVRLFQAGTPVRIDFQPSNTLLDNRTRLPMTSYRDYSSITADEWDRGPCSTVIPASGLQVQGSFGNSSCAVAREPGSIGRLGYDALTMVAVNSSWLWASQDDVINDSDDVARAITAGDQLTTPAGNSFTATNLNSSAVTSFRDYGFNESCGDYAARYGLSNAGGSFGDGHSCRLAFNQSLLRTDDAERYHVLYDNATETVWASADTRLNESSDLADGVSTGTDVTADSGMIYRFSAEQSEYSLDLHVATVNGFLNGIRTGADQVAGVNSYQGGAMTVSEAGGFGRDPYDFNGDGDTDDTLYIVAKVTDTSVSEVWASMDRDLTSDDRLELSGPETSASAEGVTLYQGASRPNSAGRDSIMLYLPFMGGWYQEPTKRPRTNLTVPLLVTRPNGSALDGATVGIDAFRRELADDTAERAIDRTWTTDSNGMVFLTTNLTVREDGESDIGEYRIVPEITPPSGTGTRPMDAWQAPGARAKLYDVDTETYQSASIDLTALENSSQSGLEQATAFTDPPSSTEYRYAAYLNESSYDCLDIDDSDTCDTASVLLYNRSVGEHTMAVDTAAVADTPALDFPRDPTVFNTTEPVGDRFTSPLAGTVLSLPSDHIIYDEATDTADFHRDLYIGRSGRPLILGVQVTELYSNAAGTVVNVSITRGEDEQQTTVATATTNEAYGTAFVKLMPSDSTDVPTMALDTDAGSSAFDLGDTTVTLEATSVDSASDASIEINGQPTDVAEGDSITVDGETLTIDTIIHTGGSSGRVVVEHEVWPIDEYVEIDGTVSTSDGSKQRFSTHSRFR